MARTLALITAPLAVTVGAGAANRQATGISQNSTPALITNIICTSGYTIIADGNVAATPGFCPNSGQAGYAITLTFNVRQTEYASRLVIWSNAGNFFNDYELRVFDLTVTYVDPVTLATQTYTKTNVQIADTTAANVPVYHDFTDAGGNPMRLYGVKTVTMSNLRDSLTPNSAADASFREVQVDVYSQAAAPNLSIQKTSVLFSQTSDPLFHTPGNDVTYQIQVTNTGAIGVDADGLFVVDRLPPELEFFNGDADGTGPGTGAVNFTGNGGGLTFPAGAVRYATTLPSSFAACTYSPVAGYDPAVRYICIRPTGVLHGSTGSPAPTFTAQFRARIR